LAIDSYAELGLSKAAANFSCRSCVSLAGDHEVS
jgi:hypothetical protein